jgi:hypothetical protein
MSLQLLAHQLAAQGRGDDTQLVHMSAPEVAGLQALAIQHGGRLTRNPQTGLLEAGFLSKILPALAGIALDYFVPGLGEMAGLGLSNAATAGLAVGAADTLATGSLKKGLMAGLGAYGGANIGDALTTAGGTTAVTPQPQVISAAPTVGYVAPTPEVIGGPSLSGSSIFTGEDPTGGFNTLRSGFGDTQIPTGGGGISDIVAPTSAPPISESGGFNALRGGVSDTQIPTGEGGIPNAVSKGSMSQGILNLGNAQGRSAFMSALGSSGPFDTPGYNKMFNIGTAAVIPALSGSGSAPPSSATNGVQNQVTPYTGQEIVTGNPLDPIKFVQTPLPAYQANTTPSAWEQALIAQQRAKGGMIHRAGGGLTPGSTPGEGMHRTISQMRGVEHLMRYSGGGISNLGGYSDGGQLLRGPGDGVSDSIPAQIGQHQPARLAEGEFVVPARIVSELGNGSTNAGAKQLYAMIDRIQAGRHRTMGAKHSYANDTNAARYLPA